MDRRSSPGGSSISCDQYSHVRNQYCAPQQLGLLERFHRALETEEVYWKLYNNPQHARECLAEFQVRYNTLRPHWALLSESGGDPLVPADVYSGGEVIQIPHWQGWARGSQEAEGAAACGMRQPSRQRILPTSCRRAGVLIAGP